MKIVVTGRQGQVARSLIERAGQFPEIEIMALGRPELDLTVPESVQSSIVAARPDFVISAAAYTAVDRAEDEPDVARAINAEGARAVAAAAASIGTPVLHLSTDYVFSGDKVSPYLEDDRPDPRTARLARISSRRCCVLAPSETACLS